MRLRTGLIGTGMWGRMHAIAYHRHPATELVAVCDLDEGRCRAFAAEFGIPRTYRTADELAADPEVEAVSVATPDFAHLEPALAVIREKKPLLIEKPLATTVEDARAIVAAANDAGILAMVDFHNRFNPQFDTAKRQLTDGVLGAPRYIYMRHSNTISVPLEMLSWPARSSSLWFLGSHSSDLVRWLFADEAIEVYGAATHGVLRARGLDVPDVWTYILRFAGGGVASIENAWILPASLPGYGDFRSEIIGEKGVYYTQLQAPEVNELYADGRHQRLDYLTFLDIHGAQYGFTVQSIQYFADCVLNDVEPFIPLTEGLANTRILCAVEESARHGTPVALSAAAATIGAAASS
jgi:predicted dehydrogenase